MKKLVKKSASRSVEAYVGPCKKANCKKACKDSGKTTLAAAALAGSVRVSARAY